MKEIKLTRGKVAVVDDSDYEFLSRFRWCARPMEDKFYAVRRKRRSDVGPAGRRVGNIAMHTVILGLGPGDICDHKDGDGLNNQRSNIRKADLSKNNGNSKLSKSNTSGFKGVCWKNNGWEVSIGINGKQTYIGRFKSRIEAARAYDLAADKHWGEFAKHNALLGLYEQH